MRAAATVPVKKKNIGSVLLKNESKSHITKNESAAATGLKMRVTAMILE